MSRIVVFTQRQENKVYTARENMSQVSWEIFLFLLTSSLEFFRVFVLFDIQLRNKQPESVQAEN